MPFRRNLVNVIINQGRRRLSHTKAGGLPIVALMYRAAIRIGWGDQEASASFRGLELTAPAGSFIVPPLVNGFYEKIELDIFERLAATGTSIVDVGGNIGVYACAAARHLPAGGRALVFEPVPAMLGYLRRNLAANDPRGLVQVEACAVGDMPGTVTLHLSSDIARHSVSAANAGAAGQNLGGSLEVPLVALDLALPYLGFDSPDLIKIDVEGYDGHVLRGARKTLAAAQPALLVEYGPEYLANCGFDPAEFLDLIFDNYPAVFMIDDPRQRIMRCSREQLAVSGRVTKMDLVACARPEHIGAVTALTEELAGRG